MSESAGGTATFYGTRAEQLAILYLTRRKDLRVVPEPPMSASGQLDVLVEIVADYQTAYKSFAVQVKARLDATHRNQVLREIARQEHRLMSFGMPVCLFFFAMKDDEGFYAWLVEPATTSAGKPILRLADYDGDFKRRSRFEPLDDGAIDEIVKRVSRWYDLKISEKHAAGIAVPISKKRLEALVKDANAHDVDADRSFPLWVEEIQRELNQRAPLHSFEVIPVEGRDDEGKEIITADRGAVQIVDDAVRNAWNHRHFWAVTESRPRSRST